MFALASVFSSAETDVDIAGIDKIKILGDLVIEIDETIDGDVIVMKGNLIVRGTINGNVVVYFGDSEVDSTGKIYGDLVNHRGRITIVEGGEVTGSVVESNLFDVSFDEKIEDDDSYERRGDFYERAERIGRGRSGKRSKQDIRLEIDRGVNAKVSYNKVDGFFLGLAFPKRVRSNIVPKMVVHGFIGYGFANKRWQYHAEINKWLFNNNRLEFGFEGHDLTDTEDDWIIGNAENSLAAFFINEDFRDYFYRYGFGAHISQRFGDNFIMKVKYLSDEYDATHNHAKWSLFKGNDPPFTPNFGFLGEGENIEEGTMCSLIGSSEWKFFGGHMMLSGSVVAAGYDLGGDFEFTRAIIEAKGLFDLDKHQGVDFRLRLGNTVDESKEAGNYGLPPQKYFTLGGISTMRAHDFKELSGKQMALLNLEYKIFEKKNKSCLNNKHSKFKAKSYFWLLKLFKIGVFADIGSVEPGIFKDFDMDDYETDVGFAFMNDEENIRLNIARRTDTGKKDWVLTFRIKHSF